MADEKPVAQLELVDTDDLIDELRRRHGTFFLIAKPLSLEGEQYSWRMHWGGAGSEADAHIKTLGLIELGKNALLNNDNGRDTE